MTLVRWWCRKRRNRIRSDGEVSNRSSSSPSRLDEERLDEKLTMHEANDATPAQAYTRQLYTALGVGRSSTKVRRPMLRCDDYRSCEVCNETNKFAASKRPYCKEGQLSLQIVSGFLLTTSLATQEKREGNKNSNPTGKCFNNLPTERDEGKVVAGSKQQNRVGETKEHGTGFARRISSPTRAYCRTDFALSSARQCKRWWAQAQGQH